ncbi:hypothetical protein BD560DRAFT_428952 [Blakeslea trispora]|nr:hypothetical protein BD560DRAFT_428952 [Blakeslea trispora]
MELRDEQVAVILRGVQASERYAREARDKIDFSEQKIDMLQATIEEQQVFLKRVVTNDVNMSQAASTIGEDNSLPPAAMISKPKKSDCYLQKNILTLRIYYFVMNTLGNELRPVDDEDFTTREKKINRLSAYKEVSSQLANAVVVPLLDFSRAARDTQQLSKDLTYKQFPNYLREKGKQEDFWLEEDLLAVAYRNCARLIKPNETTEIAPFGQGEPSYSAEIDVVSSSVMGQQQVGDKRPAEEEDNLISLVSRLRFIRNLVQSIIGTICVTTIQRIRKTFTLLTFAIKQTVDLDTSCSTSLFASAYLSHLRCPLPS